MKILIIPNNMETVWFHMRNRLPAEFLSKLGHEVRFETEFRSYMHPVYGRSVDPGLLSWADVIVLNRHYDVEDDVLRHVIDRARGQGKRIVYETDDLLETPPNCAHPEYLSIRRHFSQVRMLATEADVVTTTGIDLREKLRRYNPNVVAIPYCIDRTDWKRRKGRNKKVRVGWQGRGSHPEDLLLILDAVRDLQEELDFEFIIFGLSPIKWEPYVLNLRERRERDRGGRRDDSSWYGKIMKLDEKLKKSRWKHHPFVPFEEYSRRLSKINLDIGLCPLADTSFNRSKSVIKFYQYAMVGTATLASDVPPFRGKVSYVAESGYEPWKTRLAKLITDNEFRKEVTEEQRQWVRTNRDIRTNIHLWEEAYSGRESWKDNSAEAEAQGKGSRPDHLMRMASDPSGWRKRYVRARKDTGAFSR